MSKIVVFWIASSVVLFLLSLVYLEHNLHRKNSLFAWWLCLGVTMQLVSAYGLVLGCPQWLTRIWSAADVLSFTLASAVLLVAFTRRSCPVNQTLLYGLGAMIAFNLAVRWWGGDLSQNVRSWLVNIAFLGPAIFLLLTFSNIRADRLPLRIRSLLSGLVASDVIIQPSATAMSEK
ncbi:MAG: hypothetical protein ACRD2B_06785 [Terriglobia bacterium]